MVSTIPKINDDELLGDLAARRERRSREGESSLDPGRQLQNLKSWRYLTILVISVVMA
jgi:hypothetical protein